MQLEAGKSLPPPSLLKRKILIKNKKRAPKGKDQCISDYNNVTYYNP